MPRTSRRTALQLALLYGSPQIVDMLLAAGADPNQAGDEGRKPLEFLLDRDFEFAVRMTICRVWWIARTWPAWCRRC